MVTMRDDDLITAWSELGDAAAHLSFVQYDYLSERVRSLQKEVSDLIDWRK